MSLVSKIVIHVTLLMAQNVHLEKLNYQKTTVPSNPHLGQNLFWRPQTTSTIKLKLFYKPTAKNKIN